METNEQNETEQDNRMDNNEYPYGQDNGVFIQSQEDLEKDVWKSIKENSDNMTLIRKKYKNHKFKLNELFGSD